MLNDFTADEVDIDRSCWTRTHLAGDRHHKLITQGLGGLEGVRRIRVAHDLQQALAIAQIDEDDAAVVAPAMHPAEDSHGLLQVRAVDGTAVIATHNKDRF